jgi:hypothetical protein
MQTQAFVDWLAATIPTPTNGVDGCRQWGADLTITFVHDWRESKARNGYKWAASHPDGFEVMAGRPDMGTHFIAPGHALQEGRKGQLAIEGLIITLERYKAKYTRIDLAVDAIASGLAIDDLAAAYELGEFTGAARKWSYVTAPNGGQCLYIGSRSSEHFVRIYNKASEQAALAIKPADADWKRIELEAKGMSARAVGADLRKGAGVATTAVLHIQSVVSFPGNPAWNAILGKDSAPLSLSHRRLRNTERWLLGTVAHTLAKTITLNPKFKLRFEQAVKGFLDDSNRP